MTYDVVFWLDCVGRTYEEDVYGLDSYEACIALLDAEWEKFQNKYPISGLEMSIYIYGKEDSEEEFFRVVSRS